MQFYFSPHSAHLLQSKIQGLISLYEWTQINKMAGIFGRHWEVQWRTATRLVSIVRGFCEPSRTVKGTPHWSTLPFIVSFLWNVLLLCVFSAQNLFENIYPRDHLLVITSKLSRFDCAATLSNWHWLLHQQDRKKELIYWISSFCLVSWLGSLFLKNRTSLNQSHRKCRSHAGKTQEESRWNTNLKSSSFTSIAWILELIDRALVNGVVLLKVENDDSRVE